MPDEVPPLGADAQRQAADFLPGAAQSPMDLALAAAARAGEAGEVPVGAVVTDAGGRVLAVAGNRMRATRDPSAHAEMLALREAARHFDGGRLVGCDLWVTLEPCPMCASACGMFRIRRLIFGAYDPKGGGVEHGPRIFNTAVGVHRPEIIAGFQETPSKIILRTFFQGLRSGDTCSSG